MIETVKRILGLGRKPTGTKLIISCEKLERRVALLENNRLEEYTIERETDRNIVGGIYKAESATSSTASKPCSSISDSRKTPSSISGTPFRRARQRHRGRRPRGQGRQEAAQKKITAKDIPNIYPVGSDVIVQVSKGPISNKGPRITTNISLAGRYLVLMPFNDQCGISRKIDEPKERDRLRTILRELELPEGMGVIMRTAGQGQRARYFVRDLAMLLEQWAEIARGMQEKKAPAELFREPDLVERSVRDFLTDDVDEVLIDDLVAFERMQGLVEQISKRAKKRIHHYGGAQPIFDFFGVQPQIESAFHARSGSRAAATS